MSLHADLLRQARQLALKEPRRPSQASLRRAISASYYALFHLLVDEATKRMFAGRDRAALRGYLGRAFVHGDMKRVAQQFSDSGVSPKLGPGMNGQAVQSELAGVAATFVDLQPARHEADYDTTLRFTRRDAIDLVDRAEQAFRDWNTVRRSVQADVFLAGLLAFGNMRI